EKHFLCMFLCVHCRWCVYCLFPTARCFLEKDSGGACGSYMSRWYYSQQTKKCMHFWYGGCGGNENRFLTEDECFRECVSAGKITKLLKLDAGTCSNFSMKWFFEVRSGECVQFWYGGCDGNSNRFNTQEDCEIHYKSPHKTHCARCFLEKDSGGACGSYMSRWYYSQQTKKCMHFWYGGCGGNENRFLTEDECFRECVWSYFTRNTTSLIRWEQIIQNVVIPCISKVIRFECNVRTLAFS
uniref:BPTI/Kunitz inhibitor domain-containing protein n=1 Tax=Sinocyclocheilus anshuiensis TaxID=1608454 RepID=A0A671KRM6_9TELE